MSSVELIHVFGLCLELNLLGIESTNDPKCLGNNHGCLEGLEMKIEGKKLRTPLYRGWGTAPPIVALGRRASQSPQT